MDHHGDEILASREDSGGEAHRQIVQSSDDGDNRCVICFEDYKEGEDITVMPCSSRHRFHEACLSTWFERSRSCPLCRYELPIELPAMAASEEDGDTRYFEGWALFLIDITITYILFYLFDL
ncbi:hypothetical protein GUJ93_ZPchr0005g15566 [Zizania palustris]|uniref:RING-type domain-containing protein n=1 Tax=Zizania palustris TaxID=103762 RepID=A0A8J5W0A5_ZIZPA|nr:hypothetical protein GUJ93_ZPchr0005g15566 [Zizania palustris]